MKERYVQFGLVVILIAALLAGGCAPTPTPTAKPPEQATIATEATATPAAKPIKLVFWWWGEEGLGQEEWVRSAIARYRDIHPNVTIEVVFQGLDEVLTNYAAAAAARQGPDIATLWYGMYMYDAIWAGQVAPIDPYVSAEEMAHWSGMEMNMYDGKMWAGNIYNQSNSMTYNKELFAAAGLDPERPPETWGEMLDACEALKNEGIPCMGMGSKDGWIHGPFMNLFLTQTTEVTDIADAVTGKRSWTEEPYTDFWYRLAELRDKGYINSDVTSLDYYQGMSLVEAGKAAMTCHASDASAAMMKRKGEDVIGAMAAPSVSGAPLGWLPGISYAFFITEWSPNKEAAADFLTFFHTPEVLAAAYEEMEGVVLPADDRFDASLIQSPGIKKIFELQQNGFKKNKPHLDAVLPWGILGDGIMPAFQLMLSDNMSPEDAAKMTEEAAKTWRELNPELLEKYTEWAAGL